jgi:hypothetical protein
MLEPDMTLLLAMQGRDGLLVAADRRATTTGGTYGDSVGKIVHVYKNCLVSYCGDDAGLARPVLDTAIDESRASTKKIGDAEAFAECLSRIGRKRFVTERIDREPEYSFAYIVAGYSIREGRPHRPILNTLTNGPSTKLLPSREYKGWFMYSGRGDIVPHYSNLLGEPITDIPVDNLRMIAALVLLDTAAMCVSVSRAIDMFIIRPGGYAPVPTKRLIRGADKIRSAMSSTLRAELELPEF